MRSVPYRRTLLPIRLYQAFGPYHLLLAQPVDEAGQFARWPEHPRPVHFVLRSFVVGMTTSSGDFTDAHGYTRRRRPTSGGPRHVEFPLLYSSEEITEMQYMLLITQGEWLESGSETEQHGVMDKLMSWWGRLAAEGKLKSGAQLQAPHTATTV